MSKQNKKSNTNKDEKTLVYDWKITKCPFCGEEHSFIKRCPVMEAKIEKAQKKSIPVSFWGNVLLECLKNHKSFEKVLEEVSFLNVNQIIRNLAQVNALSFFFSDRKHYDSKTIEQYIGENPLVNCLSDGILPNINDIAQYICSEVGCNGSSLFVADKKKLKELKQFMFYDKGRIVVHEEDKKINMQVQFIGAPNNDLFSSYDEEDKNYYYIQKDISATKTKYRLLCRNRYLGGLFSKRESMEDSFTIYVLSEDYDSILKDFFESHFDWKEMVENIDVDSSQRLGWIRRIAKVTDNGTANWEKYSSNGKWYAKNIYSGECILNSEKLEVSVVSSQYLGDDRFKKHEPDFSIHIRTSEYDGVYITTENGPDDDDKKELVDQFENLVSRIEESVNNGTGFLQENPIQETRVIEYTDVLVVANSLACRKKGHQIFPYRGIVQLLDKNNEIVEYPIYVGYCRECYCYYAFESDYKKMLSCGKPLCRICETGDKIEEVKKGYFYNLKSESILTAFGYTVQAGSELSDDDRRDILKNIINKKLLGVHEVVDFLNWLVKTRTLAKYSAAVAKWKSDIEYIEKYAMENADRLKIDQMTVKKK